MELRPVDPYPHRVLAKHLLAGDDPQQAVPHLTFLDRYEVHSAAYALELARLHRAAGRLDDALAAATKAVRIDGYDASTRELAAAIAIEAGRLEDARMHLEALVLLEPGRDVHRKRLEALGRLRP
jgi:Flp pilus assembly protein TadD